MSDVIDFKKASIRKTFYKDNGCRHGQYVYDLKLKNLYCSICKKEVNPIAVIDEIEKRAIHLAHEKNRMEGLIKKLEQRKKVKCKHCGKFSGSNPVEDKKCLGGYIHE